MKVVNVSQMRALEQAAANAGVREEELVFEAARGIRDVLLSKFPNDCLYAFFCGKGNNGNDGRLCAKLLQNAGRKVKIFSESYRENPAECPFQEAGQISQNTVRVDALLGIGFQPPLRPQTAQIIRTYLQDDLLSPVVSIDVPSGLDADSGNWSETVVTARMTVSCGPPKSGLFADKALPVVGRIVSVPLPIPTGDLEHLSDCDLWCEARTARDLLPKRYWDAHKYSKGHLHIIAGAPGMSGAAVLCAKAAISTGTGLVTVWTQNELKDIIAQSVPEVMVRGVKTLAEARVFDADALVVGPGWGRGEDRVFWLQRILETYHGPILLDADAIYALSRLPEWFCLLGSHHLLTPHRGEWERLPQMPPGERRDAALKFTQLTQACGLFKGPATLVAQRGLPMSWNATGNSALATAGSGDVLSGICGSLLAQGLSVYDAARLGAHIHGLCADLYVEQFRCRSTLTSSKISDLLPKAFSYLESTCSSITP